MLNTCTHVFVRQDHVKKPLEQQAYKGPHLVMQRFLKYYKLSLDGHQDTVGTLRNDDGSCKKYYFSFIFCVLDQG